jgi:hypothetical protein
VAKKNFKGGLDSLLQSTTTSTNIPPVVSKSDNVKPNELRATFIVREDYLEKIKAVAYWDRLLVKDVINTAIGQYIEKYGNIKPVPQKNSNL